MALRSDSLPVTHPAVPPARETGHLRIETVGRVTPALEQRMRAVARAAREVDGVLPFGEHKWLRLLRGDDHSTALLAWLGSELVGAGHCDVYHTSAPHKPCRLSVEMVVHPRYRGRGYGRLLLGAAMAIARDEGAEELHLWSYGDQPAARYLADEMGFQPARRLLQLGLDREALPLPPKLSADLRLRSFESQRDAYTWLALHNRVFAQHPEQGNWDAADLQARLGQPWFDPADLLLVEDATSGVLLGFCWVKLPADTSLPGEIYIVGVDPAGRGRRLGRLLTQAGLAHIRASGRPGAALYVEADNAPALKLYHGFGFHTRAEHVCYAKTLAP